MRSGVTGGRREAPLPPPTGEKPMRDTSAHLGAGAFAAVVACGLLIGACDHAATLTQPSGTPGVTGPANPQLAVRIDSRGSAVAIGGVSEVTFDARATPGDKLRYEIQFGDGGSATTALATHVYAASGTFTTTLTVIDAADRR